MTTTMAKSAIVTKDEDTAAKCSQLKMKKMKTKTKGKAQLQDDSIMGTNNSSIVSKRSVERLYYADEPHFFRYFVKKPQRRSPLINRGYHLRMKAIDQVVHRFLTEKSSKQKIVINLGCGYDPLPWQCLSRYPDACQGVKFIDIDYRELMLKKCHTVQNTPELNQMLTNLEITKDGDLLLQSGQYLQLGCDLRELTKLHQALASAVDIENCQVLFTAEVSITYMSVEAADSVIKWASTLPEARFCLLEQLLPDGMSHPFAQTMMAHFEKLNTPLRPVKQYPTTEDQERRFRGLGWKYISATNLWELWTSPDFMTSAERAALDKIEAFDEWEEFALFAHHYVLLVADTVANLGQIEYKLEHNHLSHQDKCTSLALHAAFAEYPKGQGFRRFAQPLSITGPSRSEDGIGNFAGMGLNHRLDTCVVYGTEQTKSIPSNPYGQTFSSDAYPSSRMCHTITDLGGTGALLVGGRASPDNALADCWLYHKWLNIWERVDDLPKARYRHSAVSLDNGSVLVATGRCNSQTILDEYVIWDRRLGWVQCTIKSLDRPLPAYGATFAIFPWKTDTPSGIFAGGITRDGVIQQDAWIWKLEKTSSKEPVISFTRFQVGPRLCQAPSYLARFGAVAVNHCNRVWLIGGILNSSVLKQSEICVVDEELTISWATVDFGTNVPRPLLVGISAISANEQLVIMGGSAVCFSFGSYWNKGCYTLQRTDYEGSEVRTWKYLHTKEPAKSKAALNSLSEGLPNSKSLFSIPRIKIDSAVDLWKIISAGQPAILEGLDLGPCTTEWTTEYLKACVGVEREIIVHEASEEHMNFTSKNFSYVTKKFGQFMDEVDGGAKLYLRSLSAEKPSEIPADIAKDFPSLAGGFRLPPELSYITKNAHSSPLRISGPVIMWLHYDVMANVLCQIRGTKRLLLFPPTDVKLFDFEPGASSSSINVFDKLKDPTLACAHTHEAVLQPGDVLFIPSLWLHTTAPTSGSSISVNVFFRNMQSGYAAGKDVYGNRDLQAYEKGRQDISKVIRSFNNLPVDARGFYLQRLADEFGRSAC